MSQLAQRAIRRRAKSFRDTRNGVAVAAAVQAAVAQVAETAAARARQEGIRAVIGAKM